MHATEVQQGARFEFGANWSRFLQVLTDKRIRDAEQSLVRFFGQSLDGKRFLDIGSGSGLFSLAAHRLGAIVHSFDYDPTSVACTAELRLRYGTSSQWTIEEGSALSTEYLASLGTFDIVYSWGVLHHTGDMWQSLAKVAPLVAPRGQLFVALYNDQGWKSRYWTTAKRLYNHSTVARLAMTFAHLPVLVARIAARAATMRLSIERGMSLWHDYIDWLGGYPFEVASVDSVVQFFEKRGFVTMKVVSVGRRQGCNEFLFEAR